MATVTISWERRAALGRLLLVLDDAVNVGARNAFESAHIHGRDLEQQRSRALDPEFSSDAKWHYMDTLNQRNAVAALLGFVDRTPHDLGWQADYLVCGSGGEVVFVGCVAIVTVTPQRRAALGRLLLALEEGVNSWAKVAFESAYISGENLERQKDRALHPHFSSEAKRRYGEVLLRRNALAGALRFGSRTPHDLGWQREYTVSGSEIIFAA